MLILEGKILHYITCGKCRKRSHHCLQGTQKQALVPTGQHLLGDGSRELWSRADVLWDASKQGLWACGWRRCSFVATCLWVMKCSYSRHAHPALLSGTGRCESAVMGMQERCKQKLQKAKLQLMGVLITFPRLEFIPILQNRNMKLLCDFSFTIWPQKVTEIWALLWRIFICPFSSNFCTP